MEQLINCFNTESTENIAQYLLGMYLEHETPAGKLAGYIVDCEAYLGPDDEAAHSYGMRDTPRVRAMYGKTRDDLFIHHAYPFDFEYDHTACRNASRGDDSRD